MDTLTIPTKRNAAEARLIMAETDRLLAADAKRAHHVNVRASATVVPPAPVSAHDLYFAEVEKHLAEGLNVAQSRRAVAVGQRHLLDAYLAEFSASSHAKAQVAAETANRDRRRRNHR